MNSQIPLDIPTLEAMVTKSEVKLDSVEHWLTLATLGVVLGLVLEYGPEVADLLKNAKTHRIFDLRKALELCGAVLVTLGVAGELAFQFRASSLETGIRADTHQIEAVLQAQTNNANATALAARAVSHRASADLAIANTELAEEKRATEKARQATEAERLARVELESEIAPRRLTLAQEKRLGSTCTGLPHNKIQVSVYGQDPEAEVLASQIIAGLSKAGLDVVPRPIFVVVAGEPDEGVLLHVSPEDEAFGRCLVAELRANGQILASLNATTHKHSAELVGAGYNGGIMLGPAINPGEMNPAGPLKTGADVELMVGVKPCSELLP